MSAAATLAQPERTRLLWLIDSLTVGGAESLVVPFARNLDRSQFDLTIVCLATIAGNAIESLLRDEGVPVEKLGARNLRDLAAFRRLVRILRERRIELLHAHLTYASIWGAAAARLTGVPYVATLHVAPPRGGRAGVRDRLMRWALNHSASRVIAVSDALRTQYIAAGGLAPRKIVAVHNGIDVQPFQLSKTDCRQRIEREFAIPSSSPLIVAVSVLRPGKGIEVLLDAMPAVLRRLPDAHLLIIGDGPMRAEWGGAAERRGLSPHVHWAGYRHDVERLLPGCDLLVLPTLADAFPTVLLEAMAAGVPIVASEVGGIPEIVVPGVTGRLVPAGDPERLFSAIAEVLASPADRDRMSAAARETAAERFSTGAWITRLTTVYEEVLE